MSLSTNALETPYTVNLKLNSGWCRTKWLLNFGEIGVNYSLVTVPFQSHKSINQNSNITVVHLVSEGYWVQMIILKHILFFKKWS